MVSLCFFRFRLRGGRVLAVKPLLDVGHSDAGHRHLEVVPESPESGCRILQVAVASSCGPLGDQEFVDDLGNRRGGHGGRAEQGILSGSYRQRNRTAGLPGFHVLGNRDVDGSYKTFEQFLGSFLREGGGLWEISERATPANGASSHATTKVSPVRVEAG